VNVFVLDADPVRAAEMHCDKHVIKMVLETAQMLCTALTVRQAERGLIADQPYAPTHRSHPCTIWAGETRANFLWLCDLGEALAFEHLERYRPKAEHASLRVIEGCRDHAHRVPAGPLTPHAQAMPDCYRVPGDAVVAYRAYYRGEKASIATWRPPRRAPAWWPPHAPGAASGTPAAPTP